MYARYQWENSQQIVSLGLPYILNLNFDVTKSCTHPESIHVSLLRKSTHFYIQSPPCIHQQISEASQENKNKGNWGALPRTFFSVPHFTAPPCFHTVRALKILWSTPWLREFNHIHWVLRRQGSPVSQPFLVHLAVGNSKPQSEDERFLGTGAEQKKFTLTGCGVGVGVG